MQFVHIGKCGGSTVEKLLPRSPVIIEKYSSFFESHINGVVIDSACDYLFCLRNPIDRAFSAFEWRKKLVAKDSLSDQVHRFPGERKVLRKYKSLGTMARSLYQADGRLDQAVARDFHAVHHLRESIAFYCHLRRQPKSGRRRNSQVWIERPVKLNKNGLHTNLL